MTREDCKNGIHTSDNQGLCWWCGTIVNQEWWDAYACEDLKVEERLINEERAERADDEEEKRK